MRTNIMNTAGPDFPLSKCYHELFEAKVNETPNAIAVSFEEQKLTYKELNVRANNLSHLLIREGVEPEKIVAILGDRNNDFWTIVLSILKSGGVYLPLNPYHPAKVHLQVLEQSKPHIVISTNAFKSTINESVKNLSPRDRPQILLVGEILGAESNPENPNINCSPTNLSCILFTSGSTGKPKGAMIEHVGMINHIFAKLSDMDIKDTDIVAQNGPQSFDISVWQFLGPLLVGGQVRIFNDEIAIDPVKLINQVVMHNISILEVVPSQLRMMLDEISNQAIKPDSSNLRWIVPTGETLPPELVRRWFSIFPKIPMLNTYGTTECSDDTAHYPIYKAPKEDVTNIPIGHPIPNMQLYILNSDKSEVPEGVSGELYIGGIGVGRGYLNDPIRTDNAFIQDKFSSRIGSRLYKTGDLARKLPDGNFEFLGRLDNQIKIHGIRIEPGEIQTSLAEHPKVRTSVVVAQDDQHGKKRIIAYIIPDQETHPTRKELHRFLIKRLPNYMVPSGFMFIKEMPLTANGKIDRKALPPFTENHRSVTKNVILPRSQTEKILISIAQDILKIENIDIYDNFFELGGNSLSALELIHEVLQKLNIEIKWSTLFKTSHFARLAQLIDIELQTGRPLDSSESNIENPFDDVKLDFHIESTPVFYEMKPNNIFLTGATGFVGSNLLYELLHKTEANIYCLVRAHQKEDGMLRIVNSLRSHSLWNEAFTHRIIPVIGDLSKRLLGLSEKRFSFLSNRVETIYHNGAIVNFVYPYSLLKSVNVFGTHEVLKLANQTNKKPIHFISTLSVFPPLAYGENDIVLENEIPYEIIEDFDSGYGVSKCVAEKLVILAKDRGLNASIYRLGTVMGNSITGICNIYDWFCRMLKGCVQLGKVPDIDMNVSMSTVNYVSSAIVQLSRQRECLGKAFHLTSPYFLSWRNIIEQLRLFGYKLDLLPYNKWRTELIRFGERYPEKELHFLLHFFPEEMPNKKPPSFGSQNTLDGLEGTGITPESSVIELFRTYLVQLTNSGYLDILHVRNN